MKKNYDGSIVTLDRQVFDKLMTLAEIGATESSDEDVLAGIQKHLRKFNQPLQTEHVDALYRERQAYQKSRALAIDLVKRFQGKVVSWQGAFDVVHEGRLLGFGLVRTSQGIRHHKTRLRVRFSDKEIEVRTARGFKFHTAQVNPEDILGHQPLFNLFEEA